MIRLIIVGYSARRGGLVGMEIWEVLNLVHYIVSTSTCDMLTAAQKASKDTCERLTASILAFEHYLYLLTLLNICLRSSRAIDFRSDSGDVYEATKLDGTRAQLSRGLPVE